MSAASILNPLDIGVPRPHPNSDYVNWTTKEPIMHMFHEFSTNSLPYWINFLEFHGIDRRTVYFPQSPKLRMSSTLDEIKEDVSSFIQQTETFLEMLLNLVASTNAESEEIEYQDPSADPPTTIPNSTDTTAPVSPPHISPSSTVVSSLSQPVSDASCPPFQTYADLEYIRHQIKQLKAPVLSSLSKPSVKQFYWSVERWIAAVKKISLHFPLPSIHSFVSIAVAELLDSYFELHYPSISPDSLSFMDYFDCLFAKFHPLVQIMSLIFLTILHLESLLVTVR